MDGSIILKWMLKKDDGGMDWINLSQDRDKRRALANMVVNSWLHKMQGIF
jgi:hypothetical protein